MVILKRVIINVENVLILNVYYVRMMKLVVNVMGQMLRVLLKDHCQEIVLAQVNFLKIKILYNN